MSSPINSEQALLSDFNLLQNKFSALTESYRLLVGATEELTRTPAVDEKTIQASVIRTVFLGNILDQLLIIIQISLLINLIYDDSSDTPNPYV